VADSVANVIRRIDSDSSHTTTTFVGKLGAAGSADGVGEAARFSQPEGISLDPSAAVLYVADTANHRIRAVDLTTRAVRTIAGSAPGDSDGPGVLAHFNFPTGLATAPDGRLFVLSAVSQRIKVVLPDAARTVVTLAGSGDGFSALTGSGGGALDGAGTVARFSPQLGVAWTGTFLAISDGPALRVRALVPGASAATTQVYTVAFSGTFGSSDGFAMEAKIGPPGGLAAAADGSIYVADGANGAIRVIRQGQ
jgi:DNA-binding beta-propeller fold protein YncE